MICSRLPIKQIISRGLLTSKQTKLNLQSKRFRFDDPLHDTPILYRDIGDSQDKSDWILCAGSMSIFVFFCLSNIYMNWEEYRVANTPGYDTDNSRFDDEELGIPPISDMTYAPLKKSIIERGTIIDRGETLGTVHRSIKHFCALRDGIPSPFDN